MHVLNQIARTERLTLGDGRKKHISPQMTNNAYIFSVNVPSELIPNSFFMLNISHIKSSQAVCKKKRTDFGLIFVKFKGLENR